MYKLLHVLITIKYYMYILFTPFEQIKKEKERGEKERERKGERNLIIEVFTSEFEIIRNLSTPNSGYHARQRGIALCSILSMRKI